jgi:integrase
VAITPRPGPRGTKYRVTYRDSNGKQQTAGTFGTLKEAEKAEEKALARRTLGLPYYPPSAPVVLYPGERKGVPTLVAYAEDTYLPNASLGHHAKDTYGRALRSRIIPAMGEKSLAEITATDVRNLFRQMEDDGVTSSYITSVKSVISGVFQMAIEDPALPDIKANPTYGVKHKGKKNGRRRAITKEQYATLLAEIPAHYRLLVRNIVSSGIRWEEAMALKETSLDDDDYLNIDHVLVELTQPSRFIYRYGTKNGLTRRVKIDHTLAEELRTLPAGFLFLQPRGGHISGINFRNRAWKPALKRAGLPSTLKPTDLRRVHATWLREGGAKLESIRDRLGHHDVSITDLYIGTDESGDAECLSALGEIPSVPSKTGETRKAVTRRTRKRKAA